MSIAARTFLALAVLAMTAVDASAQRSGTLDRLIIAQATGAGSPSATAPGPRHSLVLEARLTEGGAALKSGVIWRVFAAQPAQNGELPLVIETPPGGTAGVRLAPGDYLVHAAFGRAGATKRVTVGDDDQMESLVLNAGGLILDSVVGEDKPVPPDRLTFEIMQQDGDGDLVTVVPQASAGRLIRLSAGTYHVVSRYGEANAVVRADIEVEAGKLTEAVMRHTGAEVTLKLVSEEGGEALANTSWTVTTQDGITVHESIGAFPSIILAAGNYTAIARHQKQIYSRDFIVSAGDERDVEVRLEDLVQPETGTLVEPTVAGPAPAGE
ncbi:MAG: hypothetical protein ACRED5_17870 [Propylenella sp.]